MVPLLADAVVGAQRPDLLARVGLADHAGHLAADLSLTPFTTSTIATEIGRLASLSGRSSDFTTSKRCCADAEQSHPLRSEIGPPRRRQTPGR